MNETSDPTPAKSSIGNVGLAALLLGAAIFVALLVVSERIYFAHFPDTIQDKCSFGSVTNERYRELLSTARKSRFEKWNHLTRAFDQIENELNLRLRELLRSTNTSNRYERIAIAHALMRAYDAEFRSTLPDTQTPFEDAAKVKVGVRYSYRIDLNDIGLFTPIFPQIYVSMSADTLVLSVRGANIQDGNVEAPRSKQNDQCPRVPSQEWMKKFYPDPN